MILQQVRDYVEQRGQATLADIALHVDADESAVRGMLQRWIDKGKVERRTLASSCGSSCDKCAPAATELYVWKASQMIESHSLPFPTCK